MRRRAHNDESGDMPSPPQSPEAANAVGEALPVASSRDTHNQATRPKRRASVGLENPSPAKKVRRRSVNVNNSWLTNYGLTCTTRDAQCGKILTVSCRFCYTFGREALSNRTKYNKPIAVAKHWSKGRGGFRTDNFTAHFQSQHAQKYEEFEKLSIGEKENFFSVNVPFAETLRAHFSPVANELVTKVRRSIVVDILQEMLLEDQSYKLDSVFKESDDSELFDVTIKDNQNFEIVIGQVMLGGSFRFVQRSIARMKSQGTLAYIGSISEADIAKYVQSLSAISLQYISSIINSSLVWGYSVAFDAGSNHGDSYLDVRARFFNGVKILNVHILAIPLRARHTGENMALAVARLFESLLGNDWTNKLVGLSSDGAASMVGRISGAVTRLESMVSHSLYRVWCGAHQLDLAVQDAFSTHLKTSFQDPLHSLIGYLRRQTNLKQQMGTVCPTVATTRWLSIGEVCKWIITNRHKIQEYLDEKSPEIAPGNSWWLLLYAINSVMREVNLCFRYIQGRDTLIQQQTSRFQDVLTHLRDNVCIEVLGTSMDILLAATESDVIAQKDSLVAKRSALVSFIEQLGSYPTKLLDEMTLDDQNEVMNCFSIFILNMYANISNLVVMRDSTNAPSNRTAPPVLPVELCKLCPREFYALLEAKKAVLLHSIAEHTLEQLEEQFLRLRRMDLPEACKKNDFCGAWKPLGSSFELLKRFCGALASVFPTTATVESDFSLINIECDDQRRSLSQLSLAGILHSKQWDEVKRHRSIQETL